MEPTPESGAMTDVVPGDVAESAGAGEAPADESNEARSECSEDEVLLSRTQRLISKIMAAEVNPNPRHLHALASILETQESRCLKESGSSNNARSSYAIGRLINLVRENDEFYELISSRFLSESRYNISIRAAACRVLLSCPSAGIYPDVFDDTVLDNFKCWIVEDTLEGSADVCNWKRELGRNKPTDLEMLKTYATGLLAISLAGGAQVVENILTSGLSAKLMRYLRLRILGEASSSQKDSVSQSEVKHTSVSTSAKFREEYRGRFRPVLDGLKIVDECLSSDHNAERDREKSSTMRQTHEEEGWQNCVELLKNELASSIDDDYGEGDIAADDMDILDGKLKFSERQIARSAHEDADESVRDDLTRRRTNRLWPRSKGMGRIHEGTMENEKILLSPSSGLRLGDIARNSRDKNLYKTDDIQRVCELKKNSIRIGVDPSSIEEDNDDRFTECLVGSRDISELIKKATRAAEAEARAANAPSEAIKAAGDAAAELVRSTALEVWKSTSEENAAFLAASKAVSTVIDAALATKFSRSSLEYFDGLVESKVVKSELQEELEEFFLVDGKSLAQLREKYSILCLQILGEYVEALGPVLHEKGVDVCLALLQRFSGDGEAADNLTLLPEVLKLICALAAHKKFASLFVDRGGMQKLLAVRRASDTFVGLSSCLFTIGSLQGVMERVCALTSDNVHQMVELALKLLECSEELARQNAAIFLASAFVFRSTLESFDAQDGMQKMLNLLQCAASIRSGGNSGVLGMPGVSLQNDRSSAEVLSSQEKAIAYRTCVALRQYFRAHLLLLVDSLRPNKGSRNVARGTSTSARASYKPLDISNEAMDLIFRQIQRDRKLGSAFVRARWPAIDKFLSSNGHIIMLELCQAPTVERYLHELAQYALGILHIATLVPYGRKLTVNATLSNDRLGMAVILDAANGSGYVDPEVIIPALNLLVNLVCPPPSISNKPSLPTPNQLSAYTNMVNGFALENRERHLDRSISERNVSFPVPNESWESNLLERGAWTTSCSSQTTVPTVTSGVVGDRKICLGPGAGCAGLAAQLEQGYRQAREAVRANNGIKVLLHLLHPRMITPPQALDSIRALACRVLLGLARDETIAHILTKLQVGKKLSELIRDLGSQASGNEPNKWQAELAQVAIELIAIVTNSGRASTLAATDAAAPTLRRIERAAIAAATPITYHSRELLLLIHEHLLLSGLTATAAALKKEADLTPLPYLSGPPLLHQTSVQEISTVQAHWPSGRTPCGFLLDFNKFSFRDEDNQKFDLAMGFSRKKSLAFASNLLLGKSQLLLSSSSTNGVSSVSASGNPSASYNEGEISLPGTISNSDLDHAIKSPIMLTMKRKLIELKDPISATPSAKRLAISDVSSPSSFFQSPNSVHRSCLIVDGINQSPIRNFTPKCSFGRITSSHIPVDNSDESHHQSALQTGIPVEQLSGNMERMTLDSLVVQYLKHQHRQCPAPITTLPPLSLLQPHVCPEPSRSLNAPANMAARACAREVGKQYRGIHAGRRDRQFVYSRFRLSRTCRDNVSLLTCINFLGNSDRIVTGSHSGELKIFDTNSGNVLENYGSHQTPVPMIQSAVLGDTQLILSSGTFDVKLWDASSFSNGPFHSFDGCKAAHFSHSSTTFAALSTDASSREILLYDIETCNLELRIPDSLSNPSGTLRGTTVSLIHFSPLDTMLLWNGVLWDRRSGAPLHRFDQFTDYGGGGFHPSGNEVILNSEVWDIRKFKLLRSVPSLDQTVIKFNSGGDVIYAILRRNLEDITSAVNTRRVRHPLFPAFRTIDALNYSDIATVPVDRCVLDFAADSADTYVGVVAMDDNEEMFSSAKLYEIGRRRPTDDDSDPDDGGETEEEDDEDDSEADVDSILDTESDGERESDSDDVNNNEDDEDIDSGDEPDGDFNLDDVEFDGGQGIVGIMAESDEGANEDSGLESYSSDEEGGFTANGFGF
ncbi:DDB1- and CUL4-associated factor homolog 1 [Phalaenopsis equestris]|uniref:DDB1- and CUL4-associated factor homolog 1 n=1 Tax=Phalaenopsis equestris TaxID=78828 RepID=UPI0009E5245C|nr:DDB1- and CUL4-associated factor homolog 1 [Phalaenopsis equestris]